MIGCSGSGCWRSAGTRTFSLTAASDFRPDGNVLTLEVRGESSEPGGAGERRAAFRELALHTAAPGAGDRATPTLSGPGPREGHGRKQ